MNEKIMYNGILFLSIIEIYSYTQGKVGKDAVI